MYNDYIEAQNKAMMAQQEAPGYGVGTLLPPTKRKRLEMQRDQLVKHLSVVDAALKALDAHPELEEFAETLARAGV